MKGGKILIVDDDADFASAIQAILENANYTVITASDRTEGMEKIRTNKPDLVILDVMMNAWQDGFEMSRELRSDPAFQKMPILMLTGAKNKTGIDFKSTAGDPVWLPVDGFLDKPVEPDQLLKKIRELLQKASEYGA
jgi:CheY-like chemotaxis protein